MKKLLSVFVLMVLVWGCAKKITPSNSGSQASNNPAIPAAGNTSKVTVPAAEIAASAENTGSSEKEMDPKENTAETEAIAAGQTIYKAKCGTCHALKVTTDFTADRWVGIMAVMAPNARLSDTEKENVHAYVKANAKK
jgi:mono/diheme cytochrome c family protein